MWYLRSILQQSFFNYKTFTALSGRRINLTKPKNFEYEIYVMKFYFNILVLAWNHSENLSNLAKDEEILKENNDFKM